MFLDINNLVALNAYRQGAEPRRVWIWPGINNMVALAQNL